MKFVKSVLKVLPEIMVLLSSMSYIIIRLVADINKVSLPTWFDNLNIPTVALFVMVFILLYRSKEKRIDRFEAVDNLWGNRNLIVTNQKKE
ncbi:bacteriocin immunity protein [Streptococcus mitis]|uniref:bacteriocin immunity protein n=1 Tax=Streptococcus mitis TaxID=28037 RepID=UPI0027D326D8|nr:bacteriocin immunity protein [Streptococcus mitis]